MPDHRRVRARHRAGDITCDVTRRATSPYRDGFNVSDQAFFSGTFDPAALATAAPATYRPNAQFGLADQYQSRRQMRLNVHWTF